MFSRLSQLTRHLSSSLPNYAHRSAAALSSSPSAMTSSTPASNSDGQRMIHTAGCLIIGDEVLGGKVHLMPRFFAWQALTNGSLPFLDDRYKFRLHGEVLLLAGHGAEARGGDTRRRRSDH